MSVQLFIKFILAQLQREVDLETRFKEKGKSASVVKSTNGGETDKQPEEEEKGKEKRGESTISNPVDELLGYTVTSQTFFFQSSIEETVT